MKTYELLKEAKDTFNKGEQLLYDANEIFNKYKENNMHLYMTLARLEVELKTFKHNHEHLKEVKISPEGTQAVGNKLDNN